MNKRDLIEQMEIVLEELSKLIDAAYREYGSDVYQMQLPDGKFLLADLLVAKTNLLCAIADLHKRPVMIPYDGSERR